MLQMMQMNTFQKVLWAILGLLIYFPSQSEAVRARGCRFNRCPSFINTGFRQNFVVGGQRFSPSGSNRFNSTLNPNDFFTPTGFSNLVQIGNRLVERNSLGQLRELQIDRNGALRGASEAKTVRQLRELYLENLNKFSGRNLNTVRRFLAANGGLSDGRFVIDLNSVLVDPDVPPARQCEAAVKTLNFMLNSLQFRTTLSIPTEKACPRGQVELDLGRFFDQQTLAFIKNSDPSSACTGKLRLDVMARFLMEPNRYYEITNIPQKEEQLYDILGANDDQTQSFQNKMIILNHESGVSPGTQRILEVQTARNVAVQGVSPASCYRSLDTFDFNGGGERGKSRSVEDSGIFFERDASEILCTGANGFMITALYDAKGNRQVEAPGSIANGATKIGPAVRAGVSCFSCHINGFIGGAANDRIKPRTGYTDYHRRAGANLEGGRGPDTPTNFRNSFGQTLTHGDYFIPPSTYARRAQQDSAVFNAAQDRANASMFSDKPDQQGKRIPLLAGMVDIVNQDVTAALAAKQLNVSEAQALQIIRSISGGQDKTSRDNFESHYCNLRAGSTSPLNESQAREALRRDATDTLQGLRTGIGAGITHR